MVVAYRHASFITPLWPGPNARPGRYHRRGQIAQYLSLHPLGPAAEIVRNQLGVYGADRVEDIVLNLWAIRVPEDGLVDISFDNCGTFDVTAQDLVDESYAATQELADRLRAQGVSGIKVPSSALPGTENVVLFGPRVADDYLAHPVQPEELPTGHLTDFAHPATELYPRVRLIGMPHQSLYYWESTGMYEPFHDPAAGGARS
jgi:RES domain